MTGGSQRTVAPPVQAVMGQAVGVLWENLGESVEMHGAGPGVEVGPTVYISSLVSA